MCVVIIRLYLPPEDEEFSIKIYIKKTYILKPSCFDFCFTKYRLCPNIYIKTLRQFGRVNCWLRLDKCSYYLWNNCIHVSKNTSCIDSLKLSPYLFHYKEKQALIDKLFYASRYQISCLTVKLNISLNESQVYLILVASFRYMK